MTDLQQIVGIVSKAVALETNGKQFLFVGPRSASSCTSTRQTLHLLKSVATSCVGLALSSLTDSSVLGVVCFAHPWKCGLCLQADFDVGVDEKLWVGSGLLENCNSLFGTQGAVSGGKSFGCTDCNAWNRTCMEHPHVGLIRPGFIPRKLRSSACGTS